MRARRKVTRTGNGALSDQPCSGALCWKGTVALPTASCDAPFHVRAASHILLVVMSGLC